MKKFIMSVAVLVLTAGLIAGCDSRSRTDSANKNTENNTGTVTDANNNVNDEASAAEFRKFRLDAEDQISAIDRDIANIRKRIVTENSENRKDLEDRLEKLEKKNEDLKKELADFKDDAADKRDDFKEEFYKDFAEVKQDLQDFWTPDNNRRDNTMNKRSNTDNTNNNNQTPGR